MRNEDVRSSDESAALGRTEKGCCGVDIPRTGRRRHVRICGLSLIIFVIRVGQESFLPTPNSEAIYRLVVMKSDSKKELS